MAETEEMTGDREVPSQSMPQLSSSESKIYNRMAEHMDVFVQSPAVRFSQGDSPLILGVA